MNVDEEECWFVQPSPGFCVKFKGNAKVFFNICTAEQMPQPTDITEEELASILDSADPYQFTVPISVGPPHVEMDKCNQECTSIDVIINKGFFDKRVANSELFQHFLILVSIDAVDTKYDGYDLKSRKTDWTILKNRKSVGDIMPQTIRKQGLKREDTLVKEIEQALPSIQVETKPSVPAKKPKHAIPYRLFGKKLDGRDILECEVTLTNKHDINSINVKVNEDTVLLHSPHDDELLKIYLPGLVQPTQVTSSFDRSSHKLKILLPLQEL